MNIHRVLMTNRKCFFPDHTKKLFPCYKNFVTPETKQNVCAKYSRRQNDHADPRTNYECREFDAVAINDFMI